jgi:hypothetical protein
MKIRKIEQGTVPSTSRVLTEFNESKMDTYSCNTINTMLNSVESNDPLPIGTILDFEGDEIPEGYGLVEDKPSNTYSTEEQVIGTWINGKPLYRITLSFDSNGGTTNTQYYFLQDYGINDVDEIFLVQPSYYSYNGLTYPFNYYDGNQFMAHVTKTTLNVCMEYEPISSSPFVVTLEYTKTTD